MLLLVLALYAGPDWALLLPPITKAVPRLEMQAEGDPSPSVCSGVVINAEAGFLVTAAHCVEGKGVAITVSGRHAELVRMNRVLDLAVVRFTPRGESSMLVAVDPPKMGEEIAVVGYPFGSKQTQSQVGRVVNPLEEADGVMRVSIDVIMGDSGGPCINGKGELVGIVSGILYAGPMHLGVIVPLDVVRDFVQQYLPKQP